MADNIFRSSRGRDPIARDEVDPGADASDPLAELARLIGRSEPRGGRHGGYASAPQTDDPSAPALDWAADENYAPQHDRGDDRYAPRHDDSYAAYPDDPGYSQARGHSQDRSQERGYAQDRRYADEDAGADHAADNAGYYDEQEPDAVAQRSAGFAPAASDRYEGDDQEYDEEGAYGAEADREASSPRRRGGLVVVVAVLGLAVLGTAGAFGYRAMFGGSVLPTLPPIIKPANGPNKIAPTYGDQANNAGEGAADANSGEKLVSHEEQPVDMQEPPKAPRVVSTIPITPNQNMPPPGMTAPGSPFNAAPAGAAPMPPPVVTAPASGAAPQMGAPAPPTASAPAGPRKVHTVTIRADQPADADATAAPAQPQQQPQRGAPHAAAPAPKSNKGAPGGGNQPMSLVPGASSEAPPPPPAPAPRTHSAAVAPPAAAPPAASEPTPAPAAASGGGYSVQVSSQRSEADAQSAFKELQAKYPNQLGSREATVRRADLGAKGTYYRALVGPFGTSEEAAAMCSSLKAAGGNCLVQRN